MASTAYPFKVGDLIKIERPEFKTVAYGAFLRNTMRMDGGKSIKRGTVMSGICQRQNQNGWR